MGAREGEGRREDGRERGCEKEGEGWCRREREERKRKARRNLCREKGIGGECKGGREDSGVGREGRTEEEGERGERERRGFGLREGKRRVMGREQEGR